MQYPTVTLEPVRDHVGYQWWMLFVPAALAMVWISAMGYQGLNGQDGHDYLQIAKAWQAWLAGGERPVMVEHPHGYPILGALLGQLVGPLVALRIISLVGFIALIRVILILFKGEARVEEGTGRDVSFWFTMLGVSLAPFMLRYAMTTMSDVPAVALVTFAFYALVRWQSTRKPRWLFGMVIALICALTVRLAVAPIAVVMAGLVFAMWLKPTVPTGKLLLVVGLLGISAIVVVEVLRQQGMLHNTPLAEWSPMNWFRRELHSDDGTLSYMFPNLVYALGVCVHPGQFPLGLVLLPFIRWRDLRSTLGSLASVVALGYVLFVAGMPFQNDRVMLLAQPFVVLLFYPAFCRARAWLSAGMAKPWLLLSSLAVVQIALFVRATTPFIRQAEVERSIANYLEQLHPQHLYTHGMGAALRTYLPSAVVTELWYGELEELEPGSFIVVHPANLEEQWPGLPAHSNWKKLQAHGAMAVLQRPDGWLIARLP